MLRHSSDTEPGITRKRIGRAWGYFDAQGKRVTDRDEIDRLNAVALPPAYTDAWYCADPRSGPARHGFVCFATIRAARRVTDLGNGGCGLDSSG
jgi:DNA topoisomerase IB